MNAYCAAVVNTGACLVECLFQTSPQDPFSRKGSAGKVGTPLGDQGVMRVSALPFLQRKEKAPSLQRHKAIPQPARLLVQKSAPLLQESHVLNASWPTPDHGKTRTPNDVRASLNLANRETTELYNLTGGRKAPLHGLTSAQARLPAELKHITQRRKRN